MLGFTSVVTCYLYPVYDCPYEIDGLSFDHYVNQLKQGGEVVVKTEEYSSAAFPDMMSVSLDFYFDGHLFGSVEYQLRGADVTHYKETGLLFDYI